MQYAFLILISRCTMWRRWSADSCSCYSIWCYRKCSSRVTHTKSKEGFFCQTTEKKHPFLKPLRDPFESILRHVRPSISPAVISPLLRSGRDRDGQKNVDGNKRVSRGWGGGDPPPSALSHLFVLCIGKALRQNTKKIDRAAITTTMRETCYEKTSRR